jgi:DNA-binding NarL/FixJ family response regulator
MSRATRLLYVEDDPMLCDLVAGQLGLIASIEVIFTACTAEAALANELVPHCDVALLDFSLGHGSMNGIELGWALRRLNPDIGIVLLTQYDVSGRLKTFPVKDRMGWSFIQKRSNLDMAFMEVAIKSTAMGLSVSDSGNGKRVLEPGDLAALSPIQQTELALTLDGLTNESIAESTGRTPAAVRQSLSRAFRHLVPDAKPGSDLRTTAILRYAKLRGPDV